MKNNEHVHRLKRRASLLALALAPLLFSGCEYFGPKVNRRLPLESQSGPATKAPPIVSEGVQSLEVDTGPRKPAEYYTAQGRTLGPGAGTPPAPEAFKGQGKYTLNFDDADINEVAKVILGDTLKINYVINPKVTGKVSLQTSKPLSADELIPTLEMILRMNAAVLLREGSLYRIEPDASAVLNTGGANAGMPGQRLPTGYQLRVVPLRFISVQEIKKIVEPLLPPKAVVAVEETRNIMLLAGTADELESVIGTIGLFDVDFMKGMSVGVFPLKHLEPAQFIEELEKVLGDAAKGPLAGMFRLLPIERLNAVLAVTQQSTYLEELETWVERLDRVDPNASGGVHVYRVQNVDAVELATTLADIFAKEGQGSGQRRGSLAPGQRGSETSGGFTSGGGFGSSGGGAFSGSGGSSGFDDDGSSSSLSGSGGSGGLSSSTTGSSTSGSSLNRRSGTGGLSSGGFGSSSGSRSGTGGGIFGSSGGGSGGSRSRQQGRSSTDLGDMRIIADPANNALIIVANAQKYKIIENVIKQLDVLPFQVLVDAEIVEVSLTDDLKYGLQWLFKHGQFNVDLGSTGTAGLISAPVGGGAFTYSLVNSARDVQIVLEALAQDNKINVISSPSLMVLNNQEAVINVGDTVPIVTGSTSFNQSTAGTTANSFQQQETGVTLKVKPRVNAGGLVLMQVFQEVSEPIPFNIAGTGTTGVTTTFQIRKRKIESSIAVQNGDTIVLGGLIRDNRTQDITGLPWFSKIPLLGPLFGVTNKNLRRTELVVLLSPRVLYTRNNLKDITLEFKRKLSGIYYDSPKSAPAAPSTHQKVSP